MSYSFCSSYSLFISRSNNKTIRINTNTDYFDFEQNTRRTFKPKFDTNGVDDAGMLFIGFSTRKIRAIYNDTLQVNASKEFMPHLELCTSRIILGLKTGNDLSIDASTKLLQCNLIQITLI